MTRSSDHRVRRRRAPARSAPPSSLEPAGVAADAPDGVEGTGESLLDAENLPSPDEIAEEIADDLRSALEQIEEILLDLDAASNKSGTRPRPEMGDAGAR